MGACDFISNMSAVYSFSYENRRLFVQKVTWKNAAFYDRAGQRPGHGNKFKSNKQNISSQTQYQQHLFYLFFSFLSLFKKSLLV